MNAEIAGLAGTLELKTWFMASTNDLASPEVLQRASQEEKRIRKATS